MLRASSLGLNILPLAIHHIQRCCLTRGARVGQSSIALKKTPAAANRPAIAPNLAVAWGNCSPPTLYRKPAKNLSYAQRRQRKADDSEDLRKPTLTPILPADHKSFRIPQTVLIAAPVSEQLVKPQPESGCRALYPVGRPWRMTSAKRLCLREPQEFRIEKPVASKMPASRARKPIPQQNADLRRVSHLFRSLAKTGSCEEGWKAYSSLLSIPQPYSNTHPIIPYTLLHRLCRLLSSKRPKTRTQFLRLLSVLSTLHNTGGSIHLHEWNALIDHAGKGWRKTGPEDFNLALDVFNDLVTGRAPGITSSEPDLTDEVISSVTQNPKPDIYTYTSLIAIAARTLSGSAVRRATSLLQASGIPPNRITHLALLRYYTVTSQLSGIRSTLLKMQDQNLELGLDGINACLWAYGNCHRADIAMIIYRLLRHNVTPEPDDSIEEVEAVARRLQEEEYITIPREARANEVTFTTMVQTMAYHGNFAAMLNVLMDMIASPNTEVGSPRARNDGQLHPSAYSLNSPTFRAVFLGFSRHGSRFHRPTKRKSFSQLEQSASSNQPTWTLESLWPLFHNFLTQPQDIALSSSTAYWILVAFDKTSGHDAEILRHVWKEMENKFGQLWAKPNRLRAWRSKLFPADDTTN